MTVLVVEPMKAPPVSYTHLKGKWKSRGYSPAPGTLIFFDWNGDGTSDHVGIVEKTEGSTVYTVEGNSSNAVNQRSYNINNGTIMGYGIPVSYTHLWAIIFSRLQRLVNLSLPCSVCIYQKHSLSRFLLCSGSSLQFPKKRDPVSYTHLDVYKRQRLYGCFNTDDCPKCWCQHQHNIYAVFR